MADPLMEAPARYERALMGEPAGGFLSAEPWAYFNFGFSEKLQNNTMLFIETHSRLRIRLFGAWAQVFHQNLSESL